MSQIRRHFIGVHECHHREVACPIFSALVTDRQLLDTARAGAGALLAGELSRQG